MGNATAPKAPSAPKKNLYDLVTEKILALLAKGVAPWRRPWNGFGLARNYATGHVYTGINFILMNNTGHRVPYFMSFKQAKAKGGWVRRGARAEQVIGYDIRYKGEDGRPLTRQEAFQMGQEGQVVQVLKFVAYHNVFNVEDLEGIPIEVPEPALIPQSKIKRCEEIIWGMPRLPHINHLEDHPYYSPEHDYVNLPLIEKFESSEAYYATLFHELVHATGHESRLGREDVMQFEKFGSVPYAREEIVAEMGASFLCATCGIDYDGIVGNSASYLLGWLQVLREDSRFIFKAAGEAQRAADFILRAKERVGE